MRSAVYRAVRDARSLGGGEHDRVDGRRRVLGVSGTRRGSCVAKDRARRLVGEPSCWVIVSGLLLAAETTVRPNRSLSRAVGATVLMVACSCGTSPGSGSCSCFTVYPSCYTPAASGCDFPSYDAGTVDVTTWRDVGRDVAPDIVWPEDWPGRPLDASMSFSALPCRADTDCALGLQCDLAYAGGMCRRTRCSRDSQCGPAQVCAGMYGCRPECAPGHDDCAPWFGLCFSFDGSDVTRHGCFPSCMTEPGAGVPTCVAPRMCDLWSGRCVASPSAGADNGSPCLDFAECRGGRCFHEASPLDGSYPGFPGGYCFSVARRPAARDFVSGMPLPRGSCPPGSVVLPTANSSEGDPVACYRECTTDGDCRIGYTCNRVRSAAFPTGEYSTGACYPIDCADGSAVCPCGMQCALQPRSVPPHGFCERAGSGDAGGDAAVDASADTAVVDSGRGLDGGEADAAPPDGDAVDGDPGRPCPDVSDDAPRDD